MNWQYIILALAFAAACRYIVQTLRKSSKGECCDGTDCKTHHHKGLPKT